MAKVASDAGTERSLAVPRGRIDSHVGQHASQRAPSECAMTMKIAVFAMIGLTGCNPCQKLDDKLCADLGAADCAIWRAHRPAPKSGFDTTCDLVSSDRSYYDNALRSARDDVTRWKKSP